MTVRHDDVPPETILISGPVGPIDATHAAFTFTGTDDVTAPNDLQIRVAARRPTFRRILRRTVRRRSPSSLDGSHTFDVVARDRAGNVDPTPATRTFTVSRSRIALVEPEAGASLPAGLRLVRGTVVTGGQEIAVTVNGIAAAVYGGIFAALVPLTPGHRASSDRRHNARRASSRARKCPSS